MYIFPVGQSFFLNEMFWFYLPITVSAHSLYVSLLVILKRFVFKNDVLSFNPGVNSVLRTYNLLFFRSNKPRKVEIIESSKGE